MAAAVLAALLALPAQARDRSQVRAFRSVHACPSTAQHRGPCPGFQVDHIRPLCAGGEDLPSNMHWLSVEDHRFKTLVDVRECRKLRRLAATPAAERRAP
jgi:hypothetical protein